MVQLMCVLNLNPINSIVFEKKNVGYTDNDGGLDVRDVIHTLDLF